ADDHVSTARRRSEPEVELPRLVRLLDRLDLRELGGIRPLTVLRLLLLATLPVAASLPVGHAALLLLDAPPLADRGVPTPVVALSAPLALGLVVAPAAGVLGRAARPLVELDDAGHGAVEECAVVGTHHARAGERRYTTITPGGRRA